MLAGLLFAIDEAEGPATRLTATLPFSGTTLIEHQARQLIAAGATQIIVVVLRPTSELLGALSRIGRRGVAVDPVRSAFEAAERLHPLSRVLMMADGLVATDAAVAMLTHEGGDALLVLSDGGDPAGFERVGGGMLWAGIARLMPQRVTEVAALPRDYDMQSTLVRVAEQARAAHLPLPSDVQRHGHAIVRSERALADRGRRVLSAFVGGRRNWFERWVAAPVARLVMPYLLTRALSGMAVSGVAGALGLAGLVALWAGYAGIGLVLAFAGVLAFDIGATLSELRGEPEQRRGQVVAASVLAALAALTLGVAERRLNGLQTGVVLAIGLCLLAVLAERATRVRGRWWGSPPAYLLLILVLTLAGRAGAGLALAALYATATLAAAIERLRAKA